MAWRTRRRPCGVCSKVATRASSCCVSPSSSRHQMGPASTTLSAEAAEAAHASLNLRWLAVGLSVATKPSSDGNLAFVGVPLAAREAAEYSLSSSYLARPGAVPAEDGHPWVSTISKC